MAKTYDFSGWATRHNVRCSDGRTIKPNAFSENDGAVVPLVWNHQHNNPENVLGNALLENRDEGVYSYCSFNDTQLGQDAKKMVMHGDITALSIYANQLKQNGGDVIHGAIREVSLVLAGANPGAYIDTIIEHSDESDETAIIYSGEEGIQLFHAEETKEEPKMAEAKEQTVREVFEDFTDVQKNAVYAIVGAAVEEVKKGAKSENTNENKGENEMKQNAFEAAGAQENVLSHSEMTSIIADGKRYGSLKESVLQHGIEDIEYLLPEAQTLNKTPDFIDRPQGWVDVVMNGVHRSPFARIKSIHADITEDDARALGYLPDRAHRDSKGNLVDAEGNPAYKKEEVFGLLKRTTTPATIYKKQKIDRDDIIDITDFDMVSWLKTEMRGKLNEEIARAILIGDGRLASSDDKINEDNIRPIWKDAALYTVHQIFEATGDEYKDAKLFIQNAIKSRKKYRGSGNPTMFMTEDMLTACLLMEDLNGRVIYDTEEKLRTALRVSKIVTVPVMENQTRTGSSAEGGATITLHGLYVNLSDYNVGADKGGAVSMFDDFDIDYNAMKYLIETRCSGALTKPYSAVAIESKPAASAGQQEET